MVKGVSKTIIEVNNTGSKIFEKVVFYVAPEFGNLSSKQLKRAASRFAFNFPKNPPRKKLTKASKRKRISLFLISFLGLLLSAGITIYFIL